MDVSSIINPKNCRRRSIDRMVKECLFATADVEQGIRYRWPLELRIGEDCTTLPSENLHPLEIMGGYVRLRRTIRATHGSFIYAGAVLPVIGYEIGKDTFILLLDDGPRVSLSGVPRSNLDVVPLMPWGGVNDGS